MSKKDVELLKMNTDLKPDNQQRNELVLKVILNSSFFFEIYIYIFFHFSFWKENILTTFHLQPDSASKTKILSLVSQSLSSTILQDIFGDLYRKYPQSLNKPVGRTTFYSLLRSAHFRKHRRLAALCENCNRYGFSAFKALDQVLDQFSPSNLDGSKEVLTLKKRALDLKNFRRLDLSSHLSKEHSETATHCIAYLISSKNTDFGYPPTFCLWVQYERTQNELFQMQWTVLTEGLCDRTRFQRKQRKHEEENY